MRCWYRFCDLYPAPTLQKDSWHVFVAKFLNIEFYDEYILKNSYSTITDYFHNYPCPLFPRAHFKFFILINVDIWINLCINPEINNHFKFLISQKYLLRKSHISLVPQVYTSVLLGPLINNYINIIPCLYTFPRSYPSVKIIKDNNIYIFLTNPDFLNSWMWYLNISFNLRQVHRIKT
jgi:hypothetical protein